MSRRLGTLAVGAPHWNSGLGLSSMRCLDMILEFEVAPPLLVMKSTKPLLWRLRFDAWC